MGISYYDNGKYNQASRCFRKALALDSNNHQIRYRLGFSLENEIKFERDHHLKVSLENEAKFQFSRAFKENKVKAKIDLLNQKVIKHIKKTKKIHFNNFFSFSIK